jgi:hypothetical protein
MRCSAAQLRIFDIAAKIADNRPARDLPTGAQMTFKNKMPLQIKVVLVVLWVQLLFAGLASVTVLRTIQSDGARNAVEFVVVLVFLFTMYANYRFGAGSRWAYRYILVATGIATAKFIFNVATNKSISSFQVVGFALNVAMLMLLLASASKAFYQRRN